MTKKIIPIFGAVAALIAVAVIWLFLLPSVPETALPDSDEAIERGRYLVHAGGCISCHMGVENEKVLSGGLALESDYGTFYVPNITADTGTGIGGWGGREFLLALKHGRSPYGGFYFPAFPYRAYAGLTDQDVLDIGAYLMAQPAVEFTVPEHEPVAWLSAWMMAGWNLLADILQTDPPVETDPVIARGAYLVRNLGHCGECHTPRNFLGIPDLDREFAGAGTGDHKIEAIDAAALSEWSREDIKMLLVLGVQPDGEFVGGDMADVVDHNTSHLTEEDRAAIAAFLKSEE